MWRDNLDETRDKQDENVAVRLMMPMLIAALDVHTGKVLAECHERRT
ncbi:hypothetical protein [Paraburkholderia terrae]|nr:hypothetical protein [Paraburkholderia terrae]